MNNFVNDFLFRINCSKKFIEELDTDSEYPDEEESQTLDSVDLPPLKRQCVKLPSNHSVPATTSAVPSSSNNDGLHSVKSG